jgi:hypothetical protein
MPDNRSLRSLNVILERMISDGLIRSFDTNFDNPSSLALAPHIRVAADIGIDPRKPAFDERRRELRDRIMRELQPMAPDIIVSVRGRPATPPPRPPCPSRGLITGEQCRAARRLLGWTLRDHAASSGLGVHAIGAFERGETVPWPETLAAIAAALRAGGVEFNDADVRLRPSTAKRNRA